MQIKDMSVNELKSLIKETVEETLEEFFADVDAGKEVREEVKQRLIASKEVHSSKKGIPAEEVYKRLGLNVQ
ncbi:MAG: hypothetical protein AAF316_00655 [Cyanobacteria bacterium P01_A01_bin.80]